MLMDSQFWKPASFCPTRSGILGFQHTKVDGVSLRSRVKLNGSSRSRVHQKTLEWSQLEYF